MTADRSHTRMKSFWRSARSIALVVAVIAGATTVVTSTPAGAASGAPVAASISSAHLQPRLKSSDLANYWEATAGGDVYTQGKAKFLGSAGANPLNRPIVGIAATPDGGGYWLVATDGGIFSYGDARFYGSTGAIALNKPIVGMASTPTGKGYWLVASDGGIFSYGDARFFGSAGSIRLNKPIVGMASTPDGDGYWLVATDGGIFSYGDAKFFGSTGAIHLNKPIVGMAQTADGNGYWLVASDGGIFSYGDSRFYGSTGAIKLNKPIVGMATSPSGNGYWLVATDGGIFNFGDAAFGGSTGGQDLQTPIVGMAAVQDNVGPNTVVIPPGDTVNVDGSGGGPQFITLAAGAPRVIPGQTLVSSTSSAAPDGYLVIATSVSVNGSGQQVVAGRPAQLTDALSTASSAYNATLQSTTVGQKPALSWKPGYSADAKPMIQPFSDLPLQCQATGKTVTESGSVTFSPNFDFAVHIGWHDIFIPYVSYAKMGVGVNEGVSVAFDGAVGAQCITDGQGKSLNVPDNPQKGINVTPTGIPLPVITFSIGPVPVVIIPTLNVYINGEASLSATVHVDLTQSFDAQAGVVYQSGKFSTYSSEDHTFDLHGGPSISSGTAYITVNATPVLTLLLYGVVGPEFDVGIEADAGATVGTPQPTPWWSINGCLYAGVGITVPVLGLNYFDPGLLKSCAEIADSGPAPPPQLTESIASPSELYVTVGDPLNVTEAILPQDVCTDCVASDPALSWAESPPNSWPDGLKIDGSTGVITGTAPTTPTTLRVTVAVTGKTSHANSASTGTALLTINVLPGMSGVQSITAGNGSYCAVLADGTVPCWGGAGPAIGTVPSFNCDLVGASHQIAGASVSGCRVLGIGDALGSGTSTAPTAKSVIASDHGYCAVLSTSGVACWGANGSGELGDGSLVQSSEVAEPVIGLQGVAALATNEGDTYCALLTSGSVSCWGDNSNGDLGNNSSSGFSSTPVTVHGLTGVTQLHGFTNGFCALLINGSVSCWGDLINGFGKSPDSPDPVSVPGLGSVRSIASAANPYGIGQCAILAAGGVDCWTFHNPSNTQSTTSGWTAVVTPVPGIDHASDVAFDNISSDAAYCGLLTTGAVKCWGLNDRGQVGNGTTGGPVPTPYTVFASGVTAVVSTYDGFCAVFTTDTVRCWGSAVGGQLGQGGVPDTNGVPTPILGLTGPNIVDSSDPGGFLAINAYWGYSYSGCAVTSTSGAVCWGANYNNMSGTGQPGEDDSPVTVGEPGYWTPPPT